MMNITNNNGLLTIRTTRPQPDVCLGYLMVFDEPSVFEPSHGKVDVTKEAADKHNQCLSEAEIKGLDENCQVGQRGMFYYSLKGGVKTWVGTVVDPTPKVKANTITFSRKGKTFSGKLKKNDDFFIFVRVS